MLRIVDRCAKRGYDLLENVKPLVGSFIVMFALIALMAITDGNAIVMGVFYLASAAFIIYFFIPVVLFGTYRLLTEYDKVKYLPFEADDEE